MSEGYGAVFDTTGFKCMDKNGASFAAASNKNDLDILEDNEIRYLERIRCKPDYFCYFTDYFSISLDPKTYEEGIMEPNCENWKEARNGFFPKLIR